MCGFTYAILADEVCTTFFVLTKAGGAKAVAEATKRADARAVIFIVGGCRRGDEDVCVCVWAGVTMRKIRIGFFSKHTFTLA